MEIALSKFYDVTNYQLQYVDYKENEWTAPVKLTKERADKFCSDRSVTKLKLTSNSFAPLIPGSPNIKELELDMV